MSADRLAKIKARAEQVHWTSTSIEQAMARFDDVEAERDTLAAKVWLKTLQDRDSTPWAQEGRVAALHQTTRHELEAGWRPGEGDDQ